MKTISPIELFQKEFKDPDVFEQILRDLGVDDDIIKQSVGVELFPYGSFEWGWTIYRRGDMKWRYSRKYSSHGYLSNFFHRIFVLIVVKFKKYKKFRGRASLDHNGD